MPKETRMYKDRKIYLAKATNQRRRRLKKLMIDYKIDPEKKNFKLSMEELYRSWNVIKEEMNKCLLVCANFHREIHGGLIKFPITDIDNRQN